MPAAEQVVGNDAPPPAGSGPHTARWLAIGVGVVCLGLVLLFAFKGENRLDPDSRLLGQRVPDVAGASVVDGTPYDIDQARGRWVVVNFFASWCGPCIAEQPELRRFADWGTETGRAELVGVVFQDPKAVEFLSENGGNWPVIDEPGVAVAFQVSKLPESFLVAPSGVVVQRIQGAVSADDLTGLIDAYEDRRNGDQGRDRRDGDQGSS